MDDEFIIEVAEYFERHENMGLTNLEVCSKLLGEVVEFISMNKQKVIFDMDNIAITSFMLHNDFAGNVIARLMLCIGFVAFSNRVEIVNCSDKLKEVLNADIIARLRGDC